MAEEWLCARGPSCNALGVKIDEAIIVGVDFTPCQGMCKGCVAPFTRALEFRVQSGVEVYDDRIHGALRVSRDILPSCQVFIMTSDASKEGANVPGMGGYFGVMTWELALTDELMEIDIPGLELMAFAINVIMFRDIVRQLCRGGMAMVIAYIDAQASPQLLVKRGTTSPTMSRILDKVLRLWQYNDIIHVMAVAHTYGEGNEISDELSRGKMDVLASYCRQMGVRPRMVELTVEVWDFIASVIDALRER